MTVFYEAFEAVFQVIFGGISMRFLDFRQEFVDIPRIFRCSDGLEDLSGASQAPHRSTHSANFPYSPYYSLEVVQLQLQQVPLCAGPQKRRKQTLLKSS